MKTTLLLAGARRLARAGVRSAALSLQAPVQPLVAQAVVRAARPSLPAVSMAVREFSSKKKPMGVSDGDEDKERDSDSDSDDDDDSEDEDDDDEDDDEEEEEDFKGKRAAALDDDDIENYEDPDDDWDEERWGALDSEDWQGFDGDIDAVTEEGVPKWLQSVRDLSAIHEEKRMRAKLARRAMEEAKKNTVRVRKVDELGRAYGTGRRKTSTARVWVKRSDKPFDGRIKVNKKDLVDYFVRDTHREDILKPFSVIDEIGNFDVYCTVKGGGLSGQAGAIRHGLSRALQNFDPNYRPLLKKEKLLTRDPRMVERKKPGQKKARKKFQWVKR